MASLSFKRFWLLHFFFIVCFISILSSAIKLTISPANVTLFGDAVASFQNNTIFLTRECNCTSCATPSSSSSSAESITEVGRAFYKHPIRFLDLCTKTAASFRCNFTFSIIRSPSCLYKDGFAFVITSDIDSLIDSKGYVGLPKKHLGFPESFLTVEFGKNYFFHWHHVCVHVNSMESQSAIFDSSEVVDLKKRMKYTAWIEYVDSRKKITIWVGESLFRRPSTPLLDAEVEFMQFKEYMYIGFSASNGHGSAAYTVEQWDFETFNFDDDESSSTSNTSGHMHRDLSDYHHHERIWVFVVLLLGFLILVAVIFNSLLSSLTTSCTITEKKKKKKKKRKTR